MRILIIGGTRFVGRHIAHAAIERGHDVTLFHRGVRRHCPHEPVARSCVPNGVPNSADLAAQYPTEPEEASLSATESERHAPARQ